MPTDAWQPTQYERFKSERAEPFHDLVAMVQVTPFMNVIDLGCGTGELTATLAERLPGSTVLGMDRSEAMLRQAHPRARRGLSFTCGDIGSVRDFSQWDLVFSNAALHWVPDNAALVRAMLATSRPGAQIAIHVPRNDAHPSHEVAAALAQESPWCDKLAGFVHRNLSLDGEAFSRLFCECGCHENSVVIEKIYAHDLPSVDAVVEWLKGSLLTDYASRLSVADGSDFVQAYRERLRQRLGDPRPFHYTYRRLLAWALRP